MFEKIYYMNLADRTDRKEHIESELSRLGLTAERIESIDGRYYNESGDAVQKIGDSGILTTYEALCDTLVKVFDKAEADGVSNFLVLEDDAVFSDDFLEVISSIFERKTRTITVDDETKPIYSFDPLTGEQGQDIIAYEQKEVEQEYSDLPDNWALCNLGFWQGQYATKQIAGRLVKLRDFTLGTALAFNQPYFTIFKDRLKAKGDVSDVLLSNVCLENLSDLMCCGIQNGIVTQKADYSDCLNENVEAKEV